MEALKKTLMGLSIGFLTFTLFFIGLGVAFVMAIILAIVGIFMKPQNHSDLKNKWYAGQQRLRKNTNRRQGTVIDGQYDIVENH